MKIIQYQCMYAGSSIDLTCRVNYEVNKGWQPFGGVSVSTAISDESVNAELVYAQAMVRYEEQKKQDIKTLKT